MVTDLSHGPEAFGLVTFLLLGAHSLQEHQLYDNQHLQGVQQIQEFLHPSGSVLIHQSPPHRLLFTLWMMSYKYKLPYITTLMPGFIPLILNRLPLKAIRMLNWGLDNSLRGRVIQNEHPSPWKEHFQLITASSHCPENEWCFIYRQGTKLKAQDESCQFQRQK